MKTNIALIGLLIFFFSSCKSPAYLPPSNKIGVNEYGSYIRIVRKTASNIDGELIAIDTNEIVVLTEDTKECITVPISEVERFKLKYAAPRNYGWTIPVFIVYPFIHGIYSIITMPIHLIVTITVTVTGQNAFTYSDKDMTYDKLRMFARFPQGIPPHIDLASIK